MSLFFFVSAFVSRNGYLRSTWGKMRLAYRKLKGQPGEMCLCYVAYLHKRRLTPF